MQNMAKILESNSSTQRTSTPALTLGSAVKKVVKCALKSSTKIKTLEEEVCMNLEQLVHIIHSVKQMHVQ